MYRPSHARRMYRPAHARRGSDVATASKLVTVVVILTALMATVALAGNPHFVTASASRQGNNLLVSGKVAGLGNETQIHVVVEAQAACLNRGGNFPEAENKETFAVEGDFPVQNGKANFSLTLVASFQPKCSPPMRVVWGPVTITVSDTSFTPFSTTISGPGPGGTF